MLLIPPRYPARSNAEVRSGGTRAVVPGLVGPDLGRIAGHRSPQRVLGIEADGPGRSGQAEEQVA
ncbi:MAG: hypothetical protein CL466_08590 [Acidimicrobiaceae bacterium]|nr:hypothetical protein [Acidimicrobiaceae bacterium]